MPAPSFRHIAVVFTFLFALVLANSSDLVAGGKAKGKPRFTNRLAKETSPYLLMHAHNPTSWYAWGPEAFAKAKKEKKLIFLSIGYSSCFWCHVMERESFNNEVVAKILNDHFICIKVDREERPDIDQIYMTALNVQGQSGGWPLSMFLLPDGRPVVGGTYWPREDKQVGKETAFGFKTILKKVFDAYKEDPKQFGKRADQIASLTTRTLENALVPGIALVPLNRDLVERVVEELKDEFDLDHGGFGNPNRKFRGSKFPMPPRLDFLLQVAERTKDKKLLAHLTLTLDQIAMGGIYDQIGGGFHRYSTERTWTVPHFEKMLYDNAQLVEVYAKAYRMTKKPYYRRVIEETLAYIAREMTSPQGAFYSSQDAETHHEEGRNYVWTPKELADALPDKAELAFVKKVYVPENKLNFEEKYHILRWAKTPAETAADLKMTEAELFKKIDPIRKKLFDAREKRDKPFLNKIALTAWSGLMIAGYAEAGRALAEPKYVKAAANAADFALKHQLTKEGRLLRTYGAAPGAAPKAAVNAYLEDYTSLTHGLLNLFDATKDKRWLDAASKLTNTMLEFHGNKKIGGYYYTAHDHEKFFARSKDQYDGVQPSGNSQATRNLIRLARLTGDARYEKEAERTLKFFAGSMKNYGPGLVTMAQALDLFVAGRPVGVKEKKKK
ncbi:MAG: thioredoxin domain-containing protein [Planctomycetes bacterium]|nr:thioredoxin domain-containing protein [Planctomycetota bacterium]